MKNKNRKSSFTLIELLVSLTIITIIVLIVVGVYVFIIGSREKILGQTDLHQEGQYIMSLMAKDIRSSKIDYNAYTQPIDSPIEYLILQNIEETTCIHYRRDIEDGRGIFQKCIKTKTEASEDCFYPSNACSEEEFQDLTSSKVDVESLNFYIQPDENPFISSSSNYCQPRVTITFNLRSLEEKIGQHEIMFQQTILQRWTKRE